MNLVHSCRNIYNRLCRTSPVNMAGDVTDYVKSERTKSLAPCESYMVTMRSTEAIGRVIEQGTPKLYPPLKVAETIPPHPSDWVAGLKARNL